MSIINENNITYIDGFPYAVCLPDGGKSPEKMEQSEFSSLIRAAGEERMNCRMASWCSNRASFEKFWEEEGFFTHESGIVTRYGLSKEDYQVTQPSTKSYGLGFRPVLVPLNEKTLVPDSSRFSDLPDGSFVKLGTLYMNGEPLHNPLEPVASPQPILGRPEFGFYKGDVPEYDHNSNLQIGDTSKDAAKQIQFAFIGGKLVSDRVILGCVSMEELEQQFHFTKDITRTQAQVSLPKRNENEPISLWMRLGVSIDVTQAELDSLKESGLSAQDTLIHLLSSGRCHIDGDTYFPDCGNEEYLKNELNFDLPRIPFTAQTNGLEHSAEDKKMPLNDQIQSASTRQSASQPSPPNRIAKQPEDER